MWPDQSSIDSNDASVRAANIIAHSDVIDLMIENIAHIRTTLLTFEQRGARLNNAEIWILKFLAHGFCSLKCSCDLIASGYYAQGLSLLRGVLEDWSVVTHLVHQPAMERMIEVAQWDRRFLVDLDKFLEDAFKAGNLRSKLDNKAQQEGNQALHDLLDDIRNTVNALNAFTHTSIAAVTFGCDETRIHVEGFISDGHFRYAAAQYLAVTYRFTESLLYLREVFDEEWESQTRSYLDRIWQTFVVVSSAATNSLMD